MGQNREIDQQGVREELKELSPVELPTGTDRLKLSKLIRENIDASMSDEEIDSIRAARHRKVNDLMHALRYASNPDVAPMIRNLIDAVKLGLPEDSDPTVIEETRVRLFRQSYAVMRGLDRNASQAEIDEAERMSTKYQSPEIPTNVSSVMNRFDPLRVNRFLPD